MSISRRKLLLSGVITAGSAGALYLITSEAWGDIAFGRIFADLSYYGMVHLSDLPRRLMAPSKIVEPLPPSHITASAKISGNEHRDFSIPLNTFAVAVIIPTYNEQFSLDPTILSALQDKNVEVIVSVSIFGFLLTHGHSPFCCFAGWRQFG